MAGLSGKSVIASVTAAGIVLAAIASSASASSRIDSHDPEPPLELVAENYSAGDYVLAVEDLIQQVKVADGSQAIVVDSYGNETPAEILNGEVWATGDTVPLTREGADALGLGVATSDIVAAVEASAAALAACNISWSAPYGTGWNQSSQTCFYYVGSSHSATKYYSWSVSALSSGQVNTRGFGNHVSWNQDSGKYVYAPDYFATGAGSSGGKSVRWGYVVNYPKMRFTATLPPYGAYGTWH